MKLRLAVFLSALLSIGLIAAPSTSFAQLKERIDEARKKAEQQRQAEQQKAAPQPAPKAEPKPAPAPAGVKAAAERSKGKGKKKGWTEHVKAAQKKGQNK